MTTRARAFTVHSFSAEWDSTTRAVLGRIGEAVLVSRCSLEGYTLGSNRRSAVGRAVGRAVSAVAMVRGTSEGLGLFRAIACPDRWRYESPTYLDNGSIRPVYASPETEAARAPLPDYVRWATTCRRCGRPEAAAVWAGDRRRCACAAPDTPDPLV